MLEARNLALTSADALLSPFPELTLTPLVKKMMAERPELAFVVVVNHRGQIQGHPDPRRLGEPIQLPADLAPVASVMRLQPGERLLQNRALLVVEAPVSHPSEPNLGLAVVAVERAYVEAAVAASRRGQLAFLAVLLVLGVVAGFVVLGALLAPVGCCAPDSSASGAAISTRRSRCTAAPSSDSWLTPSTRWPRDSSARAPRPSSANASPTSWSWRATSSAGCSLRGVARSPGTRWWARIALPPRWAATTSISSRFPTDAWRW